MRWKDGRAQYGLISILLHWLAALAILVMLVVGNAVNATDGSSARMLRLHTAIGLAAYPLLWFRVWWRAANKHPAPLPKQKRVYYLIGKGLHNLLMAALVVMLVSGPVMALAGGYGISVFGGFTLKTAPFGGLWLTRSMHLAHVAAATVIGYGTLLHFAGVCKHAVFDRDGSLDRMLAPDTQPD